MTGSLSAADALTDNLTRMTETFDLRTQSHQRLDERRARVALRRPVAPGSA
jgi:hypothetical protein